MTETDLVNSRIARLSRSLLSRTNDCLRALYRILSLKSDAVEFAAAIASRRHAHVRRDALTDRRVATAIAAGYE